MMMTKFPTICLTILFCISAGICAAQSKDTTACMKMEETMLAGKEDAGRRIEETGRMIEEVQEKVVRQKKAMTAYRKALDPKVRRIPESPRPESTDEESHRLDCRGGTRHRAALCGDCHHEEKIRKQYCIPSIRPGAEKDRGNDRPADRPALRKRPGKRNFQGELRTPEKDGRRQAQPHLRHPEFISVLQSHGLTDEETGYCCLYAAGLNGKDISFLLNNGGRSHYNTASRIRARLGLRESDTNLSIYIRSLLANCDRDSK